MCTQCDAGKYTTAYGANNSDTCTPCPSGAYCNASTYTQCSPGTYSNVTMATSSAVCTQCEAGSGSDDNGSGGAVAEPQGIEMAPATLAYGAYRGRTLICRTPPSPVGAAGAARVELSLNGEAGDAMSDGSLIRFTYSED